MEYPIVYDYSDYRAFLKDMYLFRKQHTKYFSYRAFANKAGFAAPNFLKLVTSGQRNLTNESIAKVAKGFGLKKRERESSMTVFGSRLPINSLRKVGMTEVSMPPIYLPPKKE